MDVADLRKFLGGCDTQDARARCDEIRDEMLRASPYLKSSNFSEVHASDLERLFGLYDGIFFEDRLGQAATQPGWHLTFRLSQRMTSVGGTTTRLVRKRRKRGENDEVRHEIAISTVLLFQSFRDEELDRDVRVNGLVCRHRLDALQRVFEHEMIHLAELLAWNDSSCTGKRFAGMAGRFFGHTEMTHQLVTQRERAAKQFGIRTGDRVAFVHEGHRYTGFVNRITRRATVLVEDSLGPRYSDGKRYLKFYVPLNQLKPAE